MAFSDWSSRLTAIGATSVELTSISASYLQDAANVQAALDLLIATQSNAELLTMLNVWRANPGPFRNGYPGGGLLFGTGVAVLTGNPADDTSAISAGTGIKLTTAIGKDQANGVAGLDVSGLLKVAELPSTVATVSSGSPTNQLPVLLATTSAHLTSALAVCAGAGGGTIYCAPGTYVANSTLPPNTIIDGINKHQVTLTQANGASGDVIKGVNFATLTGKAKATGDYALGAYQAGCRNLTIDGNKANNASGYGFRVWGRATVLENVVVQNCAQDGIWTEFTDVDSFADPNQRLEGSFRCVKSVANGGDGWTMRGPHDSVCTDYIAYENAGWAMTVSASAGGYTGGISINLPNSYLNANGFRAITGGFLELFGGSADAAPGTSLLFDSTTGGCKAIGTVVGGGAVGLDIGGVNHIIDIGVTTNTDAVKLNACGWCSIRVNALASNTAILDVASEVGPNVLIVAGQVGAGETLFHAAQSVASLNALTTLIAVVNGAGGNFPVVKLPTPTLNAGGWSPVLPASNGTLLSSDKIATAASIEATTATAGAATLPANPVGFIEFTDHNGTTRKIPYYAT